MRDYRGPLLNGAIVAGLLLASWPLGQNAYARWSQRSLAATWAAAKAPASQPRPLSPAKQPRVARNSVARAPWPPTRLVVPDIGLTAYVVQGVEESDLRRGPGHDPRSSLPGQGNCVLAGHRNIYGSSFYRVDELQPGAKLLLETPGHTFHYSLSRVFATPETDLTILQAPPAGAPPCLTLYTCTLPHTSDRIVLRAELDQED
jgi:sortase A